MFKNIQTPELLYVTYTSCMHSIFYTTFTRLDSITLNNPMIWSPFFHMISRFPPQRLRPQGSRCHVEIMLLFKVSTVNSWNPALMKKVWKIGFVHLVTLKRHCQLMTVYCMDWKHLETPSWLSIFQYLSAGRPHCLLDLAFGGLVAVDTCLPSTVQVSQSNP